MDRYNKEGYPDPTAYEALTAVAKRESPAKPYRPLVYVASPFAGDTEYNVRKAREYCRFAVSKGCIPIAPHLHYPQFMDDGDKEQRELGLFFALVLLGKCDELWVFAESLCGSDKISAACPSNTLTTNARCWNMELKIAYGDSRLSKRWVNKKTTFDELCERFKVARRTTETVSEYKKFTKDRRDAAKDVGGYVLGHLKGGRRKKDTVESRSGITLDADHADGDFIDTVEMLFPHRCAIYSTHSHTPEEPRLRVVIPLNREVSPDEYAALSRLVAEVIGMDFFDDSTYEPERLMYWPSTPSDGEYVFKEIDGDVLDPDAYLAKPSDWRDCSLWPTSSRQSEVIQRSIRQQQDPLAQIVYPASRRNYTISAQIGSDNLNKGENGQVGIEVVFEYEDGSTETRFIDLY